MEAPAPDAATENDVALDLIAHLDHLDGALIGSEETTIEKIEEKIGDDLSLDRATFVITLNNGQKFAVRVREES